MDRRAWLGGVGGLALYCGVCWEWLVGWVVGRGLWLGVVCWLGGVVGWGLVVGRGWWMGGV